MMLRFPVQTLVNSFHAPQQVVYMKWMYETLNQYYNRTMIIVTLRQLCSMLIYCSNTQRGIYRWRVMVERIKQHRGVEGVSLVCRQNRFVHQKNENCCTKCC